MLGLRLAGYAILSMGGYDVLLGVRLIGLVTIAVLAEICALLRAILDFFWLLR